MALTFSFSLKLAWPTSCMYYIRPYLGALVLALQGLGYNKVVSIFKTQNLIIFDEKYEVKHYGTCQTLKTNTASLSGLGLVSS